MMRKNISSSFYLSNRNPLNEQFVLSLREILREAIMHELMQYNMHVHRQNLESHKLSLEVIHWDDFIYFGEYLRLQKVPLLDIMRSNNVCTQNVFRETSHPYLFRQLRMQNLLLPLRRWSVDRILLLVKQFKAK